MKAKTPELLEVTFIRFFSLISAVALGVVLLTNCASKKPASPYAYAEKIESSKAQLIDTITAQIAADIKGSRVIAPTSGPAEMPPPPAKSQVAVIERIPPPPIPVPVPEPGSNLMP